jgi:hypothetical protein
MVMAVVSLMAIAALIYFLVFPPGRGGDEGTWDMHETPGGVQLPPEPEPEREKPPIRVKPPDEPPVKPPVEPPEKGPGETTGQPPNRIDHEKLLREAETYIRDHEDDFPGILRRLDEIEKKCEGTPSGILAGKMEIGVRRRLDEKAFQALSGPGKGIVDRAYRFKDLSRFAEGLALFDTFPENLRTGGWVAKWKRARGAFLEDGRRHVDKALRKVKEMTRRGRYERALEVLLEIEEYGVPGFEERVAVERGKIRAERAENLLCEFVAELYHKATTDGFLAAEAYLGRKARDPSATHLKDDLKRAQEALEGARAVAGAKDKALAEGIGRPVDLRLKNGKRMVGTLKSALPREGVIVLKGMSGAAAPFDPAEIGIRTLYDLCRLKGERGWRSLASYQLFLMADLESCRQALAHVPGGGDSWLQRTTDMLEESVVNGLFARAVRMRRADPEGVYRLLETLLAKHRDAEAFKRMQRSVKAFLVESGRAIGRKEPELPFTLRSRVQELRGSRLKLIWNFAHRDQVKDLTLSGGAFRIEDGALFQTDQVIMGHAIFPMEWERYVADADFEVSRGEGFAGPAFHYSSPGQCFYSVLSGGGTGLPKVRAGLYQPYPGDTGIRLKEEHSVELPGFDFDAVHRMKLNVNGDQFKGLLDGKLIFSKRIPRFGQGRVGFRADRPVVFSGLMVMGKTAD